MRRSRKPAVLTCPKCLQIRNGLAITWVTKEKEGRRVNEGTIPTPNVVHEEPTFAEDPKEKDRKRGRESRKNFYEDETTLTTEGKNERGEKERMGGSLDSTSMLLPHAGF